MSDTTGFSPAIEDSAARLRARYGRAAAADGGLGGGGSGSTSAAMPDGEVSILTNGMSIAGWTDIKIGGGLDRMPATFDIGMTEEYPGATSQKHIQKGQSCQIRIGADTVIVGWINRVIRSVTPDGHVVRVQGRSRCQDLVDSSAMLPNMSINSVSIGDLARQLVAKFDGPIGLKLPDGDGDARPYQFSITLGQTPFELIGQVAAYEGLLVHDDAAGDLVICRVGKIKAASGFVEGINLQEWTVSESDDALFSTYIPVLTGQNSLASFGPGGNDAGDPVSDPNVTRYRPLIVISGQSDAITGEFLAQRRAVWEATRRRGRSQSVQLVCDSWRDSAGTLWTHNVLAQVDLPSCNLAGVTWLITEWEFIRDGAGTRSRITLMPPSAFSVEPSALNGVDAQLAQAARRADLMRAIGETQTSGGAVTAPNGLSTGDAKRGKDYGL